MARLRQNFLSGLIEGGLAAADTTLTSAALQNAYPVVSGDVLALVLDPAGSAGAPEIVWITGHAAALTTATILRGQEGTSAREHAAGVRWAHGPTAGDLEPEQPLATERTLMKLLSSGTYARDLNDRMRVSVDNQIASTLNDGPFLHSSATAGTYRLWNDVRATFTMDPREIQRQQSLINGEIARQKWTYT